MTDPKNTLTARENKVLALAWQCFGADPRLAHLVGTGIWSYADEDQVDMDKLATLTGGKCMSHPSMSSPLSSLPSRNTLEVFSIL